MKTAENPTFSLLCATVGRTDKLGRMLDALAGQTRRDFELVVVDQNAPGVLEPVLAPYLDRIAIVHLRSPRGLSRARNVGLKACRGRYVAFPDDDCWYPADLLARLAALFDADPGLDVLTGRTTDAEGVDSLGLFLDRDAPVTRANIWLIGNSNSLFLRRPAAERAGGFDETLGVGAQTLFRSGEETDFLLRVLAAGATGFYRRDIVVHHDQAPVGGEAGIARAQDYARGFGRVLRLHGFGASYAAMRVARSSARALLSALTGDLPTARYKALWALGTLKGFCAPLPKT